MRRGSNWDVPFSEDEEAGDYQAYVDTYEYGCVNGEVSKVSCPEVLCSVIVEPCRSVSQRIAYGGASSTVRAADEEHQEHRNHCGCKGLFCAKEDR